MSREDFETEMLSRSGTMLAEMASTRTEVRGLAKLMESHEKQDSERFMSLHERISRSERHAEELSKADTSQRIEALNDAKAQLATRNSQGFITKHGVLILVLGVFLSACSSIFTALVLRHGG